MASNPQKSILFVCLGNICRSPLAEGVFRDLVRTAGLADRFRVDSAGTGGWHIGHAPDVRAIETAQLHGIDISRLKARQLSPADFNHFDLLFGMDGENVAAIRDMAPAGHHARIALFHDYATGTSHDVPDPYYGEISGFEAVYETIRAAAASLLARLETGVSDDKP